MHWKAIALMLTVGLPVLVGCGGASDDDRTGLPRETEMKSQGPIVYVSAADGTVAGKGTRSAPLKSVQAAMDRLRDGGTVRVANGSYGALRHERLLRRTLRVEPWGDARPTFASVSIFGGTRFQLVGARVNGGVTVASDVLEHRRASAQVLLKNLDVSGALAPQACVTIRDAARDVTVEDSRIHRCQYGISGPGGAKRSAGIVIRRNAMSDFVADGIQFSEWDDVTIAGNRISDLGDPAKRHHNDAIQFVGNSRRVRIIGNTLANSPGQLMLVQDALGPIDDVVISNNVLSGAGGVALQSQGAGGMRIVNNTIWGGKLGGLLIRPGFKGRAPTDTVVANNVLSAYGVQQPARVTVVASNYIANVTTGRDAVKAKILFADTGRFQLADSSPLAGRGNKSLAPGRDILGRERQAEPSIGAYE